VSRGVGVADGGEATEPEVGNLWRKGWRSIVLFGMTIALVLLGFGFWRAAAVGKEDASLEAGVPQLIGVFSTDPNAIIHLTTEVVWHGSGFRSALEMVYVSATVPNPKNSPAILITSNLEPKLVTGTPNNLKVAPDTNYQKAVFHSGTSPFSVVDPNEYVTELPLKRIEQGFRDSQYGIPVGTFVLPQITQESHGSFFVHLPEIGFGSGSSFWPLPYLISEQSSWEQSSWPQRDLIEGPLPKDLKNIPTTGYASSDPSIYQAPSGRHLQTAYWQPASLTTMEVLDDVKSKVANATVNSIAPDGYLQGNNYVWKGDYFLEPTMSLTNQDAAVSHGDWGFFSGIAFGVAAGTGVGFISEKPNFLSLLARRRHATDTPGSTGRQGKTRTPTLDDNERNREAPSASTKGAGSRRAGRRWRTGPRIGTSWISRRSRSRPR
jgi:hypothetical protein